MVTKDKELYGLVKLTNIGGRCYICDLFKGTLSDPPKPIMVDAIANSINMINTVGKPFFTYLNAGYGLMIADFAGNIKKLVEPTTYNITAVQRSDTTSFYSAAYLAAGRYKAIDLFVLDAEGKQTLSKTIKCNDSIIKLMFLPPSSKTPIRVIHCSSNRLIYVHDLAGKLLVCIEGHTDNINNIIWLDYNTIATIHGNASITLWDVNTGANIGTIPYLKECGRNPSAMAYVNGFLFVGDSQEGVRQYSVDSANRRNIKFISELLTPSIQQQLITQLMVDTNKQFMLLVCSSCVRLFNINGRVEEISRIDLNYIIDNFQVLETKPNFEPVLSV